MASSKKDGIKEWYGKPPPQDTSRSQPKGREPPNAYPSRRAAERAAKRDAGIAQSHPVFKEDKVAYRGMLEKGTTYKRTEYNVGTAKDPKYIAIDDHHKGHPQLQETRPHVHARPGQGTSGRDYNHGAISGTYEHYHYDTKKSSGISGSKSGGQSNPSRGGGKRK